LLRSFIFKVLNSQITAVGGYNTDGKEDVRSYPPVAAISWSESAGWGNWTEEEHGMEPRNGFMTAKVPLSWLKGLCEVRPHIF
jgi:hypothetical protein